MRGFGNRRSELALKIMAWGGGGGVRGGGLQGEGSVNF